MKKPKKVPIERAFGRVFRDVRRKVEFSSAPTARLKDEMLDALVQAAFSKCVEFNVIANRTGRHADPAFVLVSNLRGICEDLISLTYLSKLHPQDSRSLVGRLLAYGTARALLAQQRFFALNNPTQPVLGAGLTEEAVEDRAKSARIELRRFWTSKRIKRDGPSVRDMAVSVGLVSTYDYIYFAASNFVHFNPQALLRTGWGPQHGPFTFSIKNIDSYYRSLSSFYGTVLFIGFEASFADKHLKVALSKEVTRLLDLISQVYRWPEVITFEEMNQRPPLYLLTHALGKVMRDTDTKLAYGAILQEVQSLRSASTSR